MRIDGDTLISDCVLPSQQAGELTNVGQSLVVAATKLNVPVLGNNPTFVPQLLGTQVGPALEQLFYLVASWDAYNGDSAGAKKIAQEYKAKYPNDVPNGGVDWGYGAAQAYAAVLTKACDNKDLSREGLQKAADSARRQLDA